MAILAAHLAAPVEVARSTDRPTPWYSITMSMLSHSWLVPAIVSPLLWGASNVIDDALVNHHLQSTSTLLLVTGCFAGTPAVYALLIGQLAWPGALTAILALLAGGLGLIVYAPYYEALKSETPTGVILMWNLS